MYNTTKYRVIFKKYGLKDALKIETIIYAGSVLEMQMKFHRTHVNCEIVDYFQELEMKYYGAKCD